MLFKEVTSLCIRTFESLPLVVRLLTTDMGGGSRGGRHNRWHCTNHCVVNTFMQASVFHIYTPTPGIKDNEPVDENERNRLASADEILYYNCEHIWLDEHWVEVFSHFQLKLVHN